MYAEANINDDHNMTFVCVCESTCGRVSFCVFLKVNDYVSVLMFVHVCVNHLNRCKTSTRFDGFDVLTIVILQGA